MTKQKAKEIGESANLVCVNVNLPDLECCG